MMMIYDTGGSNYFLCQKQFQIHQFICKFTFEEQHSNSGEMKAKSSSSNSNSCARSSKGCLSLKCLRISFLYLFAKCPPSVSQDFKHLWVNHSMTLAVLNLLTNWQIVNANFWLLEFVAVMWYCNKCVCGPSVVSLTAGKCESKCMILCTLPGVWPRVGRTGRWDGTEGDDSPTQVIQDEQLVCRHSPVCCVQVEHLTTFTACRYQVCYLTLTVSYLLESLYYAAVGLLFISCGKFIILLKEEETGEVMF